MEIACVWEHNGDDTLLYCASLPGAFTRGASLEEALSKMPVELRSYADWAGLELDAVLIPAVCFEKHSDLKIRDADSDVLFPQERLPMTMVEYEVLRNLAMKSARDFQALYDSVPHKIETSLPARETFYGTVPVTAEEMYLHTKNVNTYYFAEIGVKADNEGTIWQCRERGFQALESQPDFLDKAVVMGSYDEEWSLRKVLRRFLWHDRIHAKAMYRMAAKTFGEGTVPDIFCFEREPRL